MNINEEKIDKLARMVADGFSSMGTRIDAIEFRMATKEDLARLESRMATKEDLANLRNEIETILERYIGTLRKHFEELATRVKKIEEFIFK